MGMSGFMHASMMGSNAGPDMVFTFWNVHMPRRKDAAPYSSFLVDDGGARGDAAVIVVLVSRTRFGLLLMNDVMDLMSRECER